MSKGLRGSGLVLISLGAPLLAALFAAACGSSVDSGTPSGGGASDPSGGGGEAATTGTNGTGGNVAGTGGAGGTPEAKCASDDDCANDPKGPVCDTATGACVACTPANDPCPQGEYCDDTTKTCAVGCSDDGDCSDGTHCNTQTHACVGCLIDTDCPLGQVCYQDENTCTPGCSMIQGCAGTQMCCNNSFCADLANEVKNCGSCGNDCTDPAKKPPPHIEITCTGGMCGVGSCDAGWANCDGKADNGCEWNVLQDGPCLCAPGSTQICYQGAPGTMNVGPCKAGTQTCNPDGASWGPCVGQVLPKAEVCANNFDEDCNGKIDDVVDADGDGWTTCNGDCCDSPGACGQSPSLVNPGAFEVQGNGLDDDCDPSTADNVATPVCSVAQKFNSVTADDVAKAMDICQTTTANAVGPLKKWGLIKAEILNPDGTIPGGTALSDMQNKQTAILTSFGTGGIVPKKGGTLAGISSGWMRDEGDPGYPFPGSYPATSLGRNGAVPAVYLAGNGGALPASKGCLGNCPAGSGANDGVNIRFQIRVPTNAQSLSYDFRFFSSEYWVYQCTSFNDFYLALLTTKAPGIPADKNISFDALKNPVSVNNGFFDVCVAKNNGPGGQCNKCPAGTAQLAGTGFQYSNAGGGTSWLTTDSPVVPGETITLDLMVFDVSDTTLDSLALLDNFRWSVQSSVVGTHQ